MAGWVIALSDNPWLKGRARKVAWLLIPLLLLIYGLDAAAHLGWIAPGLDPQAAKRAQWDEAAKHLEDLVGRDLSHQHVPIDGYRFVNCDLTGAILEFQGRLPFEFVNSTLETAVFKSTDPAVNSLMMVEMAIRAAKPGAQFDCRVGEEVPPR